MWTTKNVLFYMRRYAVCLKATRQPNDSIKIEPHNCSAENLRLWQGIAQTQNTVAQNFLNTRKNAQPEAVLRSLFQSKGWTIEDASEQTYR